MRFLQQLTTKVIVLLFKPCIASPVSLLCLLVLAQAPACNGQQPLQDVRLTSTEYNLTVTFTPNPTATNYTVSFRLTKGVFFTDFPFTPPFNSSELSQTYTSVLPGHVYTVEIFENETSPSYRVFAGEKATVPLAPMEVEVVTRGNDFLFLQWVSDQNFTYDEHEISYDRENGFPQVIGTSSDWSYNLTGLEAGYSYDIYVVAITQNVKSKRSPRLSTATIPLAPINVSAIAMGTYQINITWLPDPNSFQESYTVNYTLSGSEIELSTTCDYAPCVFSPHSKSGQTLSISVYAESNSLTSRPATIQHSTAPGDLRGLTAEEGVRSLHLRWIPPADSFQVYYVIEVVGLLDKSDQIIKVDAKKTSYKLDSLMGGSMYRIHVQAESEFELGQPLMDVFRTLPEPVTNLTGSAVNTSAIQFSWNNPVFSKVDKLNISIFSPDEVVMIVEEYDVTVTSYTVSNLKPGESYTVNITVISEYTNASSAASTMIRTRPVPPVVLQVVAGETFLNLTLAPSGDGVFDSIQAMRDETVVQHIADDNGLVTFSELEPGMEYTIKFFSLSGQVQSDIITSVFFTRPRPVSDLKVATLGERSLSVEWSEPDRGGFDNFTVLASDVDGITSPVEIITGDQETVFEDLQPGTTYNITAVVLKGDQQSEAVWELNTTVPLPVTHVRVSVRAIDTVTLAWDAPVASALSGFALTFDPLNLTLVPLPVEVDQYKLEGLEPDTNYTILLFTYSEQPNGQNLYSGATAFNFSTYPESVAALQKVESLTNSITVNWTAPTSVNIDYFQLGIQPVDPATRPIPRPMNVAKNQTSTTFEGLEPGLEYTIAIRTAKLISRNRAQFGESVKLQAVTKPLPVQELIAETINTTAVVLRWVTNSTSRQNRFKITYSVDDTSRSLPKPAGNESGQSYAMEVGQLLPGYTYSISVVAVRAIDTDLAESDEGLIFGYTVPLPVGNVTLTNEDSELVIAWLPPANGRWLAYQVRYRPILRDNETTAAQLTASQRQTTVRIPNPFPGEMYEVMVVSTSNDLESEQREANIVFNPLPPSNFTHAKDLTTTKGITLEWIYDMELTYAERWSVTINAGQYTDTKRVDANKNQKDYNLSLISLVPGQTYSVTISALVMDKKSELKRLDATTKPVINSGLIPNPSSNSSVSLRYTVIESDIFDQLVFHVGDDGASDHKLKTKEDPQRTVTFDGLEAGTKYTVQVFTVSKDQRSAPKSLELVTSPNPVPVLFSSSSTSIVLTMGPPVGQALDYLITCSIVDSEGAGTKSCGQQTVQAGPDGQDVEFDGLLPYQKYLFDVLTRAEMLRGEPNQISKQYNHTTAEAAPSAVRSLNVQAQGIHSVYLEWQPPAMANGLLRSYAVGYVGTEPSDPTQRDAKIITDIPVTETSKRLENLKAGFVYKFSVFARTIAQGDVAEIGITMGTTTPAFRPGLSALKAKPALLESSTGGVTASTETKISLTFTNPFSAESGTVKYYTVIVSKDPSAPGSSSKLPSWQDAQDDSNIKVYQAVKQCDDFFSAGSKCGRDTSRRRRSANSLDSRTFIIGEEEDCTGKTYCNGPLSSDTDYYVKLRGYTQSGKFQETAYSEKIRTAKKASSNAGMAAGIGTTVAVLAAVGVVVVIIVVRRRRRPKRATKHVGPKATWEQSTMCKFSRPVKLSDFTAHVRKMEADSDFKYAEEYEDLKEVGRDQPCLAAEFPPNRPKNRFTNILPYDHSRVKLSPTDDDEGSDYINANYLPGFNSKREYIATQGPLPATRDDFWRMVWEQSVRNIVMLTRCLEKGREKSDHYWPSDPDPKFYGDLHVVVLNETHMPDWTVTELRVSLGDQSRNIRHFHYKVWPDFGVPEDHTSLIRFIRMVRERLVREGGPIITHCSAGVGRSGTFIVLDHLLQMIREKNEVDIFSIVYKLRKERVLMVQTEKQYKFIHECLLCVLEGKEDDTTYANVGQINVGFDDDEGINIVETP